MRWSVNLPSTRVKIEQALIFTSRSSWKRQMLVTSKMTSPPSSRQTLISGCASDSTLPSTVVIWFSMASRPVMVGALVNVNETSSGVVGAGPVEVLGLHGVEVVGQEVDRGLVGSRHDGSLAGDEGLGGAWERGLRRPSRWWWVAVPVRHRRGDERLRVRWPTR